MKYLIILLYSITLANASEPVVLKQGDSAPYQGLLFTVEDSQALKGKLLDLGLANKTTDVLTKENELLNKQLDSYREHSKKQADELIEARDGGLTGKIAMFILGAAITTAVTFGVR